MLNQGCHGNSSLNPLNQIEMQHVQTHMNSRSQPRPKPHPPTFANNHNIYILNNRNSKRNVPTLMPSNDEDNIGASLPQQSNGITAPIKTTNNRNNNWNYAVHHEQLLQKRLNSCFITVQAIKAGDKTIMVEQEKFYSVVENKGISAVH